MLKPGPWSPWGHVRLLSEVVLVLTNAGPFDPHKRTGAKTESMVLVEYKRLQTRAVLALR